MSRSAIRNAFGQAFRDHVVKGRVDARSVGRMLAMIAVPSRLVTEKCSPASMWMAWPIVKPQALPLMTISQELVAA
jgi:hypothetical protein